MRFVDSSLTSLSRCLCGLLNGNIGVIKSTMGELTDSTNREEAYAMMTVVWALGGTLGPIVGGSLTRPNDRFPKVFTNQFWKEYPYFLPCVASSGFVFGSLIITVLFFEETVRTWKPWKPKSVGLRTPAPSDYFLAEEQTSALDCQGTVVFSFRGHLTFPVLISIANYMSLALLDISLNALLPLFLHTPIPMGGLGLGPMRIGYVMGVYGTGTGAFQLLFFSKLVRRFGIRPVFIMCIATFIPAFLTFPFISLVAKQWGVCMRVWILVGCLIFYALLHRYCVRVHLHVRHRLGA